MFRASECCCFSILRLPVSNFARDTLTDIEMVPWFNLESLNPSLYDKISELKKVKVSMHYIHLTEFYYKAKSAHIMNYM